MSFRFRTFYTRSPNNLGAAATYLQVSFRNQVKTHVGTGVVQGHILCYG
jgi:hypothetical protein